MNYSPIIVIAGPTATGKTGLAIKLAKEFNGYIINGDSRQVYKELNIGTAKPSKEEIKKTKIPHFLFGHRSIKDEYNIYLYKQDVTKILEENSNKTAFITGGTGLYIDSVVFNYNLKETKEEQENIKKLTINELQNIAGEKLSELNESDRNNPRRIIRLIQKNYKNFHKGPELKHLYLVYNKDFNEIDSNIKKRTEQMFKNGLLEENIKLKNKDFIETIGYQEFKEYFENNISLEKVKERIYINTRKYAKRQLTWFRRNKNAIWVNNYQEAHKEISKFLSNL